MLSQQRVWLCALSGVGCLWSVAGGDSGSTVSAAMYGRAAAAVEPPLLVRTGLSSVDPTQLHRQPPLRLTLSSSRHNELSGAGRARLTAPPPHLLAAAVSAELSRLHHFARHSYK